MDSKRRQLMGYAAAAFAPIGTSACAGLSDDSAADRGPFTIKVEKDVRVSLRDGSHVVADVFRPDSAGKFPVLMSMGPYPKDIPFKAWAPADYERQELKGEFMHWESGLPEYWVPRGYVQIRCDQRGSGASPGKLDIFGPQVQRDFYDAIEWAGVQPWSNGNVGLLGDSYFAMVAWTVAQHNPPHLKAIMVAQGATDLYRDAIRHGGILSARFLDGWYQFRVKNFQYGAPQNKASPPLSAAELAANEVLAKDFRLLIRDDAPATDPFFTERTPDISKIRAAVFAYANSGGLGLHLRGTIEGFSRATNAVHRQLYVGIGRDPDFMYRASDVEKQRRFFDRFLKNQVPAQAEPAVVVTVRKAGGTVQRTGATYPLAGTAPVRWHLDAASRSISSSQAPTSSSLSYRSEYGANAAAVRFISAPLAADLELIGPLRLHLWVSASAGDADLFVAARELRPDDTEVTAQGAQDPALPVAMGWLRVSRRHADAARSTTYRTWHTYDRKEPLIPGRMTEVDVNLWPAAWIVAAGNRLCIEIGGGERSGMVTFAHPSAGPFMGGALPMPNGSPPAADVTLHTGPGTESFVVLPVHVHGA